MTNNPTTESQSADIPTDDSEFAVVVFADPVAYLARHGIISTLVDGIEVPLRKAA